MIEQIARAIADGLGDSYDSAFVSKSEWNAARGDKGGRYRDINEPFQGCYDDAATAAVQTLINAFADPVVKRALQAVLDE